MNEYRLIVTNSYGESIDLFNDEEAVLTSLEGVSLEADVNTMNLSGLDGSSAAVLGASAVGWDINEE